MAYQNLPFWLKWGFSDRVASTLLWIILLALELIVGLINSINLITPSFPLFFLTACVFIATFLSYFFYQNAYPLLISHDGGFLPPVQRILIYSGLWLLGMLSFLVMSLGALWFGLSLFLATLAYSIWIFRSSHSREGIVQSFLNLLNAESPLEGQGIELFEKIALVLVFSALLFFPAYFVDAVLPIKLPTYPVQVQNKEVQSGGKSGPNYVVFLSGWRAQKAPIKLNLRQTEWEQVVVGNPYLLKTRRGLLGGERVQNLKPNYRAMRSSP